MRSHEPMFTVSRYGCNTFCSCGWKTEQFYTTISGAHLMFGAHLIATSDEALTEEPAE